MVSSHVRTPARCYCLVVGILRSLGRCLHHINTCMLTHTTLAALRLQTSSLLQFTAQADSSGLLTFADFLVPFASLCTYMHALRVPGQLSSPSVSSGQGLVFPIGECTHARSQPTLKTYPDLFALSQERPPLDYYRTPTPVDRTALSVGIQPATLSACDSPSPAILTLKHIVECRYQRLSGGGPRALL